MISSYWVNFAKSGDPNGPGFPKWPAFAENDKQAMVFDAAPSARPVPNLDKLHLPADELLARRTQTYADGH